MWVWLAKRENIIQCVRTLPSRIRSFRWQHISLNVPYSLEIHSTTSSWNSNKLTKATTRNKRILSSLNRTVSSIINITKTPLYTKTPLHILQQSQIISIHQTMIGRIQLGVVHLIFKQQTPDEVPHISNRLILMRNQDTYLSLQIHNHFRITWQPNNQIK